MKSVLHIGIEAPTYSSEGMRTAFKELFEDFDFLDWQKVRFNEGFPGLQQRIIGKAMMCQPELIFLHLQTPESIDVDTAIELSKIGFVVNYTFDIRNDIQWYKEIAPHIGLTLFGDRESVKECKKVGIKNVDYLQSSCDFRWYRRFQTAAHKPESDVADIVFIGSNYQNTNVKYPLAEERAEMIKFMQDNFGEKFGVYGMGWQGSKFVHAQDEIKIYNQCKIAITHNHYNRHGYTSDRLFRAIGCGALTISQHYQGIEEEFDGNILSWKNFDDLKRICNFYLDNEDFREQRALHNRGLVRHTCNWTVRLKQMLTLINKHYGTRKAREAVQNHP